MRFTKIFSVSVFCSFVTTSVFAGESFLPKFGCSQDEGLREIRGSFPHLGEELFLSDDFLPIWVQNGSIWINSENEIAAQIQHQAKTTNSPGLFTVILKNYCEPTEENTAVGTLVTTSIIDDGVVAAAKEAVRVLPSFKLNGGLIPENLETMIQISLVPADKLLNSKAKIAVELISTEKDDPAAPIILDSFSLSNLKELEK